MWFYLGSFTTFTWVGSICPFAQKTLTGSQKWINVKRQNVSYTLSLIFLYFKTLLHLSHDQVAGMARSPIVAIFAHDQGFDTLVERSNRWLLCFLLKIFVTKVRDL